MSGPLEAVMVGAGGRGRLYATYAERHPEELRFVGLAEPNPVRREYFVQKYRVPRENVFCTWEELAARGQLAPAAFNCTQDFMHTQSTLGLLDLGYHTLLEKPIASTPEECLALTRKAEKKGCVLQICHELRFTNFFTQLHAILASGRIGDVISAEQRENVSFWHMSHSFVRGSWSNSMVSNPMILAKCCHDMDILYWNLGPVRRLSSHGSLIHFREENAPAGAPQRCTDGCPAADTCLFNAERLYFEHPSLKHWPISLNMSDPTDLATRRRDLETGPFGRCVYHTNNDVVDHQVVAMELESGATATLIMHGHSYLEGRTMRYDGTRGTLRGVFSDTLSIEIHDQRTGSVETITPDSGEGHGGGDMLLVGAFVQALRSGQPQVLTSVRNSMESHLMACAAEEARREHKVVSLDDYRNRLNQA